MSKRKLTQLQVYEAINLYNSGKSSLEISKRFGCSSPTVLSELKKSNQIIRKSYDCKRIYTINENYFESVNTQNKAYFLGLLYADGNVSEFKTSVCLILKNEDSYLIKLFNQDIGSNKPTNLVKEKYTKLEINSEKFKLDLIKLGCSFRKTHILEFPSEKIVSSDLIWHFIRGYFDGDGCIYTKNRFLVNICGTYNFLNSLKTFLQGFDIKCSVGKMKSVYQLQITNKKDFMKFFKNLYNDSNVSMTRKKKKYEIISDCHKESPEKAREFLNKLRHEQTELGTF